MKKDNKGNSSDLLFFLIIYIILFPYGLALAGLLVKFYYPDNGNYIYLIIASCISLIPALMAIEVYFIKRIFKKKNKENRKL